ncbi:MAG: hypothetical protein BGO23_07370 [Solirubrobacterales bacterium 67-14]|nr:MAG: hypothetical protein BGO23_07370 [Solirubrobacterales bacterium 67-14]
MRQRLRRCRKVTHSQWYTAIMPTKLRRIAVTVDPRLAAALEVARKELPGKSDAALVKELALRGSRMDESDRSSSALARILARPGVRLPSRKLQTVLARLREEPGLDPELLDRALEEDRADREIL